MSGLAVTSSGNEPSTSFPEEDTRPDTALTSSGRNELCSLFPEECEEVRPCQARPCHEFSGNEPQSSFPEKKSGLRKYWKLQWSCQLYRTASLSLLVVWVFYNFLFWLMSSKRFNSWLVAIDCPSCEFLPKLVEFLKNSRKYPKMWSRFPTVDEALRRSRMTGSVQLLACMLPGQSHNAFGHGLNDWIRFMVLSSVETKSN